MHPRALGKKVCTDKRGNCGGHEDLEVFVYRVNEQNYNMASIMKTAW